MTLKTFSVGAVLAGAVASGTLASAPTQAISLYSYIETASPNNTSATAQNIGTPNLPASGLPLGDSSLNIQGSLTQDDLTDWYKFSLSGTLPGTLSVGFTTPTPNITDPNTLQFSIFKSPNLDDANALITGNFSAFSLNVPGIFSPGDIIYAKVFDPTAADGITPFSTVVYNLSFQTKAIPTPALLPGLIGMGIAAIRKRKKEASEAAEA